MSTAPTDPKLKHRWFQFSLRSLALTVALCCVGLAIERNAVISRQRSIAEIKRIGGVITFDETRSFRPAWMQSLSGEVIPPEVVGVDLKERRIPEDTLVHLGGFSKLEELNLSQTSVNDAGLAQ